MLYDRTGKLTVATTDPSSKIVYLSENLSGDMLMKVLIHELGHCVMVSFHLLDDIHRLVRPECWIEAEEWVCNFIAEFGYEIFSIAYSMVGNYYKAWEFIPRELDKVFA